MYALDIACFEPVFRFSRRAMRRFAEAAGALVAIAEEEGRLVGFAIVQMEGEVGYVATLDVDPAWRRAGLAVRLMVEMERQAEAAGAVEMQLHVFAGNERAMRLYERLGYGRLGVAAGFYGRGLDAVVYAKYLGAGRES